ncbi:MAG: helix-turn-helix transcriptional regulator [Gaiellaceae bacterium]
MLEVPLGGEMERLRQTDLRAALDFLERLGGARDLDEFAATLVSGLGGVIPAEVVAFNEVNPALERAFFVSDFDVEANLPGATAILEQHMYDNPLVVYHARSEDGSAHTWSDFVTQRRLHATELWDGLFRPFGLERQMVALLPAPRPLLVGIVLNRCGRDFIERERALLNVLRPHLANAYRNAQARTILSALEPATGNGGEAVVLVGTLGEPLALTPRARDLLAAFGDGDGGAVPDRWLEWCRRMRNRMPLPAEPLLAAGEDLAVEARFLTSSVVALRAVRERLDSTSLRALGLTQREQEVLALVAEGHTNKQIAVRIDVLPSTVKKHLERIYDKLGVRTRTAAAAAAFRATRHAA